MDGDPYQRGRHERRRLRESFDAAADRYARARPAYPEAVYDTVVMLTGLSPGDRLVEVGPATGTATSSMVDRGFCVTCVERGAQLAAAVKARFADTPSVTVIHDDFETWEPEGQRFDLVYAATAWHWIAPTVRYRRAARALRPGGYLAVWRAAHVVPEDGDPFFMQLQDVYDEVGHGMPTGQRLPRPGETAAVDLEADSAGLFAGIGTRRFIWATRYDADRYIDLLSTFSGHLDMTEHQRHRLFGEIRRRLADRADGMLTRHWEVVLEVAQLREE